jgi:hypothetical protein
MPMECQVGNYVVMSASAGCGQYRRIAVLEVEGPDVTPAMISHRARGVVRIVRRWERLSPEMAHVRTIQAHALAATLHIRSSPPDAVTGRELLPVLRAWHVCIDASDWVEARLDRTLAELWAECPRGDWMMWLAAHLGVDRRRVVLAACDVVEPVLAHVPAGEERPRRAIEVARRWARGEATADEVGAAADDAHAAYLAAAAAARAAEGSGAAEHAANAASYAVLTAYVSDPAHAGDDAFFASGSVEHAAAAEYAAIEHTAAAEYAAGVYAAGVVAATARATSLARSADIVRAHIDAATIVAAI